MVIEAFNIIQDRIARSRMAGDPPDVVVAPKVGAIGHFDFHRADEAIEIGRQSGMRLADEIAAVIEALG